MCLFEQNEHPFTKAWSSYFFGQLSRTHRARKINGSHINPDWGNAAEKCHFCNLDKAKRNFKYKLLRNWLNAQSRWGLFRIFCSFLVIYFACGLAQEVRVKNATSYFNVGIRHGYRVVKATWRMQLAWEVSMMFV